MVFSLFYYLRMRDIFEKHLPINAVDYCYSISNNYDFKLELSFDRKSKFGHYKYWPQTKSHSISINRGLSKPLFLITFIHELAHLDVMVEFGRNIKPHGKEWKNAFRGLMLPILNPENFETKLLSTLARHLKNPKASLSADSDLWHLLHPNTSSNSLSLKDIEVGNNFVFKNRIFKKVKTRRTRALCYEARSGNNYLIPLLAKIKKEDA